jgi:hypothetical protein
VNDPLEAKQRVNAALEGKGKLPSKRSDGVAGSYPDEFKMKLAFPEVFSIALPGYENPASEDDTTKNEIRVNTIPVIVQSLINPQNNKNHVPFNPHRRCRRCRKLRR